MAEEKGYKGTMTMDAWVVLTVRASEAELAVQFYTEVFGAVETDRFTFLKHEGDPNSRRLRSVVLLFGTSRVVVTEDEVETEIEAAVDSRSGLRLVSDQDVIQVIGKAQVAGAILIGDITQDAIIPGKHLGKVRDPFGINWIIVGNLTEKPSIKMLVVSEDQTVEKLLPGSITRFGSKAADFILISAVRKLREIKSYLDGQIRFDQPVDLIIIDLDFLYREKEAEFRKIRKKGLTPEKEKEALARRTGADHEKEKEALARRTGADHEINFFYAAFSWRSMRPWSLVVGTSMMNISNKPSAKARRLAWEAEFKDRLAGDWKTLIVQKPITEDTMDAILTNAVSWRKERKTSGLDG